MVVFKSKLDQNVLKKLNFFQLKRIKWLIIVIVLLFLGIGLYNLFYNDRIIGIVWIVAAIIYLPLVIIFTRIGMKKYAKTMSIVSDETYEEYIFDTDEIQITTTKGDNFYSFIKAKYNYLYKVIEGNNCFVLYISMNQAHTIMKSDLVEGSIDQLKELLRNNLNNKFKEKK